MTKFQEDLARNAFNQALESECRDCGGTGVQTFKGAVFCCETCDGKGASPTEYGKNVLRFLAKFGCEAVQQD